MRKSWDAHWMEIAIHASEMSTCAAGRKVGAVFVRDNQLLSTGFNGVPRGYPHPTECIRKQRGIPSGEQLHLCGCAHAETNGIANAAKVGVGLNRSTVYTTTQPCALCMGSLVNSGISEIIFMEAFHHEIAKSIAYYGNVKLYSYNLKVDRRILQSTSVWNAMKI